MEAAAPVVLLHLCQELGAGQVDVDAVGDGGREDGADHHAKHLLVR